MLLRDGTLTVDKDGTANTVLGFPTAADTVADPITTSELVSVVYQHSGATDLWLAVVYR
jgi:hypothetical protein